MASHKHNHASTLETHRTQPLDHRRSHNLTPTKKTQSHTISPPWHTKSLSYSHRLPKPKPTNSQQSQLHTHLEVTQNYWHFTPANSMLTVNLTLTLETQSHLHRQRQTTPAHHTPRDTAGYTRSVITQSQTHDNYTWYQTRSQYHATIYPPWRHAIITQIPAPVTLTPPKTRRAVIRTQRGHSHQDQTTLQHSITLGYKNTTRHIPWRHVNTTGHSQSPNHSYTHSESGILSPLPPARKDLKLWTRPIQPRIPRPLTFGLPLVPSGSQQS